VLHVHRGRDQDSVTGGELAELFSIHDRTVANVCMGYALQCTYGQM
jgi:hypothetical protein